MSRFVNSRESTSIDETAFIVILNKELDAEAVKSLMGLRDELADDLVNFNVMRSATVNVNIDAAEMNNSVLSTEAGFECSVDSDELPGRKAWVLRVANNQIVVSTSDTKQSYADLWARASHYLASVFSKLNLSEYKIAEVVREAQHKYDFSGDLDDDYSLIEFFNQDSVYVPKHILEQKCHAWHSHNGWYEDMESDFPILVNLNMNAGMATEAGVYKLPHIIINISSRTRGLQERLSDDLPNDLVGFFERFEDIRVSALSDAVKSEQ